MRILYHHRTQGKGAEGEHIRGMILGFRELGCVVDIVGPPGVNPFEINELVGKNKSQLKCFLSIFAKHAPQPIFECIELLYNYIAKKKIVKNIVNKQFDFIYERYSLNTWVGGFLAKKFEIPFILEVNDATVIKRSRPLFFKRLSTIIEKNVFSKASLIITISNHFKERIVKCHGISPERIVVLPNAISPSRFCLLEQKKISRKHLLISDNSIVIGCTGAFVAWHGLEFLVSTMAKYAVEHDLFFLFVGDGPVRDAVESIAQIKLISDRVLFTGFVSSELVPYYLDLVDICVIPDSNDHCSPVKLFEYMALSKPIVLPRYLPLEETLVDGEDGLFFEIGNGNDMRDALLSFVKDKYRRDKYGKNACKAVYARHTWSKHCQSILRITEMK